MRLWFSSILAGILSSALWVPFAQAERPSQAEIDAIHRLPEAEAYYKSRPEFFTFATTNMLPADLEWHDGMDQEPFASPDAKIGGTVNSYILSYPPTLRVAGPNANNSFRSYQYDYNMHGLQWYCEYLKYTKRYSGSCSL